MSRPRLREELVRLLALVAALAVVTGAWLAGQRYYYCAPMQRIALDECCATEHEHAHEIDAQATLEESRHRCCEERMFDAGDHGASASAPVVPPAPALAVVAVLPVLTAVRSPALARATHDSRAGPPRASPLAWRTVVDVSRT